MPIIFWVRHSSRFNSQVFTYCFEFFRPHTGASISLHAWWQKHSGRPLSSKRHHWCNPHITDSHCSAKKTIFFKALVVTWSLLWGRRYVIQKFSQNLLSMKSENFRGTEALIVVNTFLIVNGILPKNYLENVFFFTIIFINGSQLIAARLLRST